MDNTIKVGDTFTYSFQFTQEDVIKFAEASGDFNPIHLDSTYAKNSIFGRTIIHGFLGGSVFSKVFGLPYYFISYRATYSPPSSYYLTH